MRDNLETVTDAALNVSSMEYNLLGRKTWMSDPDMGDWDYTYDAVGNLKTQDGPKTGTVDRIVFTYDKLNRLTLKDYPTGSDVNYKYDNVKGDALDKNSWGRLRVMYTGSETSNGHLYEYDNRGRTVKEQVQIDSVTYDTLYTYDAADRVKTMTYPGGEVVITDYNPQGLPQTLSGDSIYAYSADYDEAGRLDLLKLGALGASQQWVDNVYYPWTQLHGRGRLHQIKTGPSGTPTQWQDLTYTYDAVGNVRTIVDAKVPGGPQTQTFTYDHLDRVLTAKAEGGSTGQGQYNEGYAYNSIGNMTSKGGVTYKYEDADHKHAVSSTTIGATAQGTFSYDKAGNMLSRKLTSAGPTYSQTWDYENRLASVTVGGKVTTFTYDGNGSLIKEVGYDNLADGLQATSDVTLNWPGVITNGDRWADSGTSTTGEYAYTSGTGLHYVQLDLGAAYTVDQVKVWHYARDGRTYHNTKTQVSANGTTWVTVFDSAVSGEYAETVAGKTHTFSPRSVRYVRDWLNGSTSNTGNHWVEIEVWGTRTRVYAGQHYEKNINSGEVTKYYHFGGSRVAMRRGSVVQYLLADHLNSTALTLNSSGSKVAELRYRAFGETRYNGTPNGTPTDYRFTGQRQDSGLGLYHMGARWYDPYLNQFLSPDSVIPQPANPQSFNRYLYSLGNPLKFTDPTGHKEEEGACGFNNEQCIAPWALWDPDWLKYVGDPLAAEQAFLLFLTDPGYFIALYADTAAWNASQEVANLEVFAEYSVLHTSADDLLLNGFDSDIAAGLRAAHFLGGLGTEEGSKAFVAAAGVGVAAVAIGGDASSAVSGILLNRSLASAQQMGERGFPIAGAGTLKELRVAQQLAVDYGGSPDDWAKMVSFSYRGPDGYAFQTRWYENTKTGLRVEWKTKLTGLWRGRK